MGEKIRHKGDSENNKVNMANHIARCAIKSAKESEEGQLFELITAQIFIAFMIEGTVDHLGRILCKDWDKNDGDRPRSSKSYDVSKNYLLFKT